jgi:hypothetical protein
VGSVIDTVHVPVLPEAACGTDTESPDAPVLVDVRPTHEIESVSSGAPDQVATASSGPVPGNEYRALTLSGYVRLPTSDRVDSSDAAVVGVAVVVAVDVAGEVVGVVAGTVTAGSITDDGREDDGADGGVVAVTASPAPGVVARDPTEVAAPVPAVTESLLGWGEGRLPCPERAPATPVPRRE